MKIIVCGAGRNGKSIAKTLAKEKNDVTVIDINKKILKDLANNTDVKTINGYASYPEVLEKADASNTDMIIALTDIDEVNMIICQVAYSNFSIPTRIARIKQEAYLKEAFQKDFYTTNNMPIGVVISPEKEIVNSIISKFNLAEAFDSIKLSTSLVDVIGILCKEDCPILGIPLTRIKELNPKIRAQMIVIVREQNIIFPKGDDVLKNGDEVYFCVDYKHIKKSMQIFGYKNLKNHKTLIVGGGRIGFELAKNIEKRHSNYISAKIIEKDKEQAKFLANSLKKTKVINGNGRDVEILKEVNVKSFDTVISLTEKDSDNILISLLGKKEGAKRAISLINKEVYDDLAKDIGIDSIVSPNNIVLSKILEKTRISSIKTVRPIGNDMAELIEATAKSGSKIVSEKIKDLSLPKRVKIGAIIRAKSKTNRIVMPDGESKVNVGDTVILTCSPEVIEKVEKLFEVR